MEPVTLAEFDARVAKAADRMVTALGKFNQSQDHPEDAICSAEDLRPEFIEYFRKLLGAEIEVVAGDQPVSADLATMEAIARSRKKDFEPSGSAPAGS
jgi:hypothetical protein